MFCSVLCYVQILCRVLFFVAFRFFAAFCSDMLYPVLLPSVVLFLVSFLTRWTAPTPYYIIDKGGRKNFLREDVSAVLRDEALSAFENIVIGFHEYKSTTLTPYNREKHHFFIYF